MVAACRFGSEFTAECDIMAAGEVKGQAKSDLSPESAGSGLATTSSPGPSQTNAKAPTHKGE